MEMSCEHHDPESDDDDDYLLDVDLINKKTRSSSKNCIRCRKQDNATLQIQHSEWLETRNGTIKTTIPVAHNSHNKMSVNMFDDNIDAPLLINNHRDSFDDPEEFHCHMDENVVDDKAWRKLTAVCCMCCVFMLTEIIGGYLAGSSAIMTDAAHLLSDVVGFIVSLISIWISKRPPSNSMTFGYHRAEVLGAFFSVVAVWLLAGSCAVIGIDRLINGDYSIDADTMIVVASLGLVFNILIGGVLHGVCHSHGSSHSHSTTKHEDINVRAAAAHVIGDLLQSAGVLIAAIIIKIYPNAKAADPLCTLIFSVIVVWATARVAKDSIVILLECAPTSHDTTTLTGALKSLPGVKHVHNLHLWTLSPGKDAVSVHLSIDSGSDRDVILMQATNIIRTRFKVISCTIQTEIYNDELINSCEDCQRVHTF